MPDEKSNKKKPSTTKNGVPININANYNAEARAIQIIQVLKEISDEEHPVRQADILAAMENANPATISKTIDRLILQLDPIMYTGDNDNEYRIKYSGYDSETENIVLEKAEKTSPGKSPSVTNLRYIHDFDMNELDMLMDAVNFSGRLSLEEKERLMRKLQATASKHYKSPFYDKNNDKVKFYDFGIYTRLDARTSMTKANGHYPSVQTELIQNIKVIQQAINDRKQIVFDFNEYTKDHSLKKLNNGWRYILSPYYIVVYHELYYLICSKTGTGKISHYRIDLMSNVDFAKDNNNKYIPCELVSNVKGLPTCIEWDPEKYMREHLYMFYDEPRSITLKIPSGNYTAIHDHFGDHYRSLRCDEEGYDKIEVRCSANAMAILVMQYAGTFKVIDEEVKELVREKMKALDDSLK